MPFLTTFIRSLSFLFFRLLPGIMRRGKGERDKQWIHILKDCHIVCFCRMYKRQTTFVHFVYFFFISIFFLVFFSLSLFLSLSVLLFVNRRKLPQLKLDILSTSMTESMISTRLSSECVFIFMIYWQFTSDFKHIHMERKLT